MANKLIKSVRYNTKLTNGQFAYVEFSLKTFLDSGSCYYSTSIIIGDTPKTCRYWLAGKKSQAKKRGKDLLTGRCGLEGLIWTKQVLLDFIDNHLPRGITLLLEGSDAKRQKVYQHFFLKKSGIPFEVYEEGVYGSYLHYTKW